MFETYWMKVACDHKPSRMGPRMTYRLPLMILLVIIFYATSTTGQTITASGPVSIWLHQKDNVLVGPVVDMIQGITAEEGFAIKTMVLPWARAIEQLKTGELDMMMVIFKTAERENFMYFSDPYISVPTVVAVPRGASFSFSSLADLKGRKGLKVRNDSISDEFATLESQLDITKVVSFEQIVKMLANKRGEYAVVPKYGFLVEAKRLGLEHELEFLPKTIAERTIHIALSKKSPHSHLVPIINKKIREMKQNGEIAQMIKITLGTIENRQ